MYANRLQVGREVDSGFLKVCSVRVHVCKVPKRDFRENTRAPQKYARFAYTYVKFQKHHFTMISRGSGDIGKVGSVRVHVCRVPKTTLGSVSCDIHGIRVNVCFRTLHTCTRTEHTFTMSSNPRKINVKSCFRHFTYVYANRAYFCGGLEFSLKSRFDT